MERERQEGWGGEGGGGEDEGGEGKEREERGESRLCNRGTPYSHSLMVQQERFICKSTFLSIDARIFTPHPHPTHPKKFAKPRLLVPQIENYNNEYNERKMRNRKMFSRW